MSCRRLLGSLTDLQTLDLRNTQLCAPTDAGFQRWLQGIANKSGVVNCGPANPDRTALVALYEATNGDHWANKANWLSDRPLDDWYGVTTNANGRVTRLELSNNNLSGVLPSELGNLPHLEWLNLNNNQLSGSIPSALGNLANLELLHFGGNDLSGMLPSSLGNLTNLRLLYLPSNQLSGALPSSLGNLANLVGLRLNSNDLSGALPSSLVNLTNLQQLWLANTQLCAPTDDAFQTWLDGIGNKQGVDNCGDSESSTAIVLSVNPHTMSEDADATEITVTATLNGKALSEDATVTLSIGPSSTATRDVDYTALFTPIAIPAGQIEGQTPLFVDPSADNAVEGDETIVLIGKVDGLQGDEVEITLTDARAGGPGNPDRDALVALYEATNGDNWTDNTNWLSDRPLGEWYGVRTDENGRVTHLLLHGNQLSGSIPATLGNLNNLQYLGLNNNQLSGSIPAALGNLNNLQALTFVHNQLSGSIPAALGNLNNLQELVLFSNQLSGSIPATLGNLNNLQALLLSDNQLSGALPSSLISLTNLQALYLSNTQLCAPTDAGFQAWLDGIDNKSGVVNCEEGEPSTAIALSVNPQTIREDAGETEITVTATLNGKALSENTTVNLSNMESTAVRDMDYTWQFINSQIVIPAGSIAGSARISVTPVDDNEPEGDETTVLIGVVDGLMGDEVEITIIDDDDNPDRDALVALYEATDGDNWAEDELAE